MEHSSDKRGYVWSLTFAGLVIFFGAFASWLNETKIGGKKQFLSAGGGGAKYCTYLDWSFDKETKNAAAGHAPPVPPGDQPAYLALTITGAGLSFIFLVVHFFKSYAPDSGFGKAVKFDTPWKAYAHAFLCFALLYLFGMAVSIVGTTFCTGLTAAEWTDLIAEDVIMVVGVFIFLASAGYQAATTFAAAEKRGDENKHLTMAAAGFLLVASALQVGFGYPIWTHDLGSNIPIACVWDSAQTSDVETYQLVTQIFLGMGIWAGLILSLWMLASTLLFPDNWKMVVKYVIYGLSFLHFLGVTTGLIIIMLNRTIMPDCTPFSEAIITDRAYSGGAVVDEAIFSLESYTLFIIFGVESLIIAASAFVPLKDWQSVFSHLRFH